MILLNRRRRREGDDRARTSQEFRQDRGGVQVALLNRAQGAGEHFLGMRATRGAIAAADFPCDDGRAQGVFGTPVGGVDGRRLEHKGEDRGEFGGEMRRKGLGNASTTGMIDEGIELILQMTARDGDTGRRDLASQIAVADLQGVLQQALHTRREVRLC